MARAHGRILASIWDDPDFIQMPVDLQRLYLFLISQPNLNHAGLLPLTLRRWAAKAPGLTASALREQLAGLEQARFVIVDEDTEELLIRTFVRNDGVWKMPRVMGAMVSGALEISSRRLRAALLMEMDRIPLELLSDEPGPRLPSVREQVREHIEALRDAFGYTPPPPPEAQPKPSASPSETPAEPSANPSETLPQPPAEPSTRGRAGASRAHSPAPAPTPATYPKGGARASSSEPDRPRDGRHPLPDDFALTDAMRRWAASTFPTLDPDYETEQFVSHYRADGGRRKSWPDEWQKWMRRSAKFASERAQAAHHQPPILAALPGGQTSRPLTGTDATVSGWLALSDQLAQEDTA